MSYWIVIWGSHVRFAHAPDVFSAMAEAFGMKAEDMSVRKITHPAYLSLKKKKAIIEDMQQRHKLRIAKLPPGDRLVLPGLQKTKGKPKPEEFLV